MPRRARLAASLDTERFRLAKEFRAGASRRREACPAHTQRHWTGAAIDWVLASELRASQFGRLVSDLGEADPWPINDDACHHMGGTRMGDNPATSVVNSDWRLHTGSNVYIAGSSVFPISAYANPTYIIVALAIRLADEALAKRGALMGPSQPALADADR